MSGQRHFTLLLCSLFLLGSGFYFAFGSFVQFMLLLVFVNILFGLSLNLLSGLTGQFSLGHAGFLAVGAYGGAVYASFFPSLAEGWMQIPYFFVGTLFSGLLAMMFGFFVGVPSLRLRGDYLAIVTFGFAEIIRVVILNTEFLGGARGFSGIPGFQDISIGEFVLPRFFLQYGFAMFWIVTCFWFFSQWRKSYFGRRFLAVREDEIAAASLGIEVTRTKVIAFAISSFFAGVSGALFAYYMNFLSPTSFGFTRSIDAIIIVVLGGLGSLSGTVIAATFITLMPEWLRPLKDMIGVDLRLMVYSLLLIVMMIVRPQGMLGAREVTDFFRKRKSGSS